MKSASISLNRALESRGHRHWRRLIDHVAKRFGTLTLSVFLAGAAWAGDSSLQDLLKKGDDLEQKGDTQGAIKCFLAAEEIAPSDSEILIRLAKQHSDLIFETTGEAEQKKLAEKCLAYGLQAVQASSTNARAHLTVAIGYAKNLPFLDNQAKVNYSRLLKQETEKAIALDPKLALGYHILGCWHSEVASMGMLMKGLMKLVYGGLPKASNELAVQNFSKAVELDPARIIHRWELAKVYLATGKKDKAIDEIKVCLALKPHDKDDAEAKKSAEKKLKDLGVLMSSATP